VRRRALLAAILLLGLALRLWGAAEESFWEDEAASLRFADMPVAVLLTEPVDPGNPPGAYLLLKAWVAAFGDGELAVRLLTVFLGTATILLLYLLGKEVTGSVPVALSAALLLAVTAGHVFMSQEVRSYAPVTLLATASTWALLRALDRGSWSRWSAYVLLAFPMGWLHYQGLFVLFGQGIAALLWHRPGRERSRFPRPLLAGAAAFALLAPALWIHLRPSLAGSGAYHFWQPHADWRDPWLLLLRGTLGFGAAPDSLAASLPLSLLAIALPAALVLACRVKRLDLFRGPFLAVLYAGPVLFTATAFLAPIWQDKYLLAFQPLLILAIACGLGRLFDRSRRLGTAAALLLAGLFLPATVWLKSHSPRPDYRAAARRLLEANPAGAEPVWVYRFAHVAVAHYYPHAVRTEGEADRFVAEVLRAGADGPVHVVLSSMQAGPAHLGRIRERLTARLTLRAAFTANRVEVLTLGP
jgi:uncharacterized membrane protein